MKISKLSNELHAKRRRKVYSSPPSPLRVISGCLLILMVIGALWYTSEIIMLASHTDETLTALDEENRRNLRSDLCNTDESKEECPEGASHPALVIFYLLGSIYVFLAIATVADEFFVPALEQIAESWNMSDDIAGATLMAAGGSAPELATSLIGTFQGSDVGFGTIVGSAVFNVLFVIACCVLFTPRELAPLELTSWPLTRDCLYYSVSLLVVALVFGINSPGIIEGWEAALLLALYVGYCVLMYFNEDLYKRFHNKVGDANSPSLVPSSPAFLKPEEPKARRGSLQFPSRFRGSIFHLMTQHESIFDTAGMDMVKAIKGDVHEVFAQLDLDHSGTLDPAELRLLLERLHAHNPDTEVSDEMVAEVMKELDLNKNGLIEYAEFTCWYVRSEQRLMTEQHRIFDQLDESRSGSISLKQLGLLLDLLGAHYTADELSEGVKKLSDTAIIFGFITWAEFYEWYQSKHFWKDKKHEADIAATSAEGIWSGLMDFPRENLMANFLYLFMVPITWPLALTCGIRDVRVPGNENWCYLQFLLSVVWIGLYSFLLVDWLVIVGATLGIPAVVMGLTILAAGTSVPDLLSSVVVAKAGKGDMAVSSSIGSNIFDITVGLPLPWLLFNIIMDCPVVVGADNLFISVVVLLLMVISVVVCIIFSRWKMSYGLGTAMFVLYVVFVAQDIVRVFLSGDVKC